MRNAMLALLALSSADISEGQDPRGIAAGVRHTF